MFLPIQRVAIAALTGPLDGVQRQCGEYQRRRDALCGGLRSIGWDVPNSHGSMFVWAPVPAGYKTSMEFCLALIDKAGVICTPGSSFGPSGEGYAFCPDHAGGKDWRGCERYQGKRNPVNKQKHRRPKLSRRCFFVLNKSEITVHYPARLHAFPSG